MIVCPTVRKQDIRSHYNLTTLFYRLLWGRHIHHGLWSGDETAAVAQQQLTETLAREAGIRRRRRGVGRRLRHGLFVDLPGFAVGIAR